MISISLFFLVSLKLTPQLINQIKICLFLKMMECKPDPFDILDNMTTFFKTQKIRTKSITNKSEKIFLIGSWFGVTFCPGYFGISLWFKESGHIVKSLNFISGHLCSNWHINHLLTGFFKSTQKSCMKSFCSGF